MNTNTISFYTLGCRLNQSETAVIQNSFNTQGYSVVNFNTPADITVINTCTVTENGDADTRRLVNRISCLNPKVKIALIGCQAQIQKKQLTKLPNVRWIVGNEHKMDLVSVLNRYRQPKQPKIITPAISRKTFTIPTPGIDHQHTRANIKIQDGCDFFCSFCEIPYARGRARSRKFNDILKEANELVHAGHKELVLTGINLGTYANNNRTIMDVIDALENISELERIRISSIEPTTIPYELIAAMTSSRKLCRHLHIPLQSGHNDILKSMKRKYSLEEFTSFVEDAHQRVDGICIGTDVIVGFPGETNRQFDETYSVLTKLPIHYFHVFSYSQRQLAKSKLLSGTVPLRTIQQRSQTLRDLSKQKRRAYYQSMLGTSQNVLFEQIKNGIWTGLTDNYLRVHVSSSKNLENHLVNVTLQRLEDGNIFGKINNDE